MSNFLIDPFLLSYVKLKCLNPSCKLYFLTHPNSCEIYCPTCSDTFIFYPFPFNYFFKVPSKKKVINIFSLPLFHFDQ